MDAFIQTCYDLGLDGLELHTSIFESTDPDYLREVKLKCLRRGLPIGYVAVSNDFGKPVEDHPGEVELIKKWIDVAAFLSAPMVRVFAASVRPDCEDEEALWPPMIAALKEVTAYGAEKGIIVGLQNHNHNNVTRSGDDVLRLLRAVDHPYFGLVLDTGQYAGSPGASGDTPENRTKYDVYHSIAQTAPYALHVRAKIYRIDSGVEEWLDYPRIFDILRSVGYNGDVSVVYEGKSEPLPAIEKAVKYLRSLM